MKDQISEISVVTSPGARDSGWAIKVLSNSSYNVYNVRRVKVGPAGTIPMLMGSQIQAVNMAELFLQTGQLAENSYAIMFRVGDKYVFYVPV